jgi:plastocyanin
MRAKRWVTTAMIGVIATFGLSACGGGDDDEAQSIGRGIRATSQTGDPRFDPVVVSARLGQEVNFNFENEDEREHNFTLTFVFTDADSFVSVDVPARQSKPVRFMMLRDRPRDGFLTFYCRFHQQEGMQGRITFD